MTTQQVAALFRRDDLETMVAVVLINLGVGESLPDAIVHGADVYVLDPTCNPLAPIVKNGPSGLVRYRQATVYRVQP